MSNTPENISWQQEKLRYVAAEHSADQGGRINKPWLQIKIPNTERGQKQAGSYIQSAVESSIPTSIWIDKIQYDPGDLRDLQASSVDIKRQAIGSIASKAANFGEIVIERGVPVTIPNEHVSETSRVTESS